MLLIGDSLGNVILGHGSTLPVTLEDMERATAAVARSTSRAMIVADLPSERTRTPPSMPSPQPHA